MTINQDQLAKARLVSLPSIASDNWRRSAPADFDPERFVANLSLPAPKGTSKLPDIVSSLAPHCHIFVARNDGSLESVGIPSAKSPGLKMTRPASIPYRGKNTLFASERFAAFHGALSTSNTLIEIAPNSEMVHPIILIHGEERGEHDGNGAAYVSTVSIVIGSRAKATICEDLAMAVGGLQALTCVDVRDNAHLNYIQLLTGASKGDALLQLEGTVSSYGSFTGLTSFHAAAKTKAFAHIALTGTGAESRINGVALGHGRQHLDISPWHDHQAPHTKSDMLFKMALDDRARAVFQGEISMSRAAQHSTAHQLNQNILLSKNARVDTLPKLDILPDDVACKHGAATGPIDEAAVYYLTTRGLSPDEARGLLLRGFVTEVMPAVLSDVDASPLAEYLANTFHRYADEFTKKDAPKS